MYEHEEGHKFPSDKAIYDDMVRFVMESLQQEDAQGQGMQQHQEGRLGSL